MHKGQLQAKRKVQNIDLYYSFASICMYYLCLILSCTPTESQVLSAISLYRVLLTVTKETAGVITKAMEYN